MDHLIPALLEGTNENYADKLTNSPSLQADYLSILPVTASAMTGWKNGKFVINLTLLPKSRSLEAKFLTPAGVATKIVHLDNLALITLDDFNIRYTLYSPFHDEIIDREMVYSNRLEGEDWLFDSQAVWDEAGVNHPELTLEKNLKERQNYFNITDHHN